MKLAALMLKFNGKEIKFTVLVLEFDSIKIGLALKILD